MATTVAQDGKLVTVGNLKTFLENLPKGESKVKEDFTVEVKTGQLKVGAEIKAGEDLSDVIRKMLTLVYEAYKTDAYLTASGVSSQTIEVGATVSGALTSSLIDGSYTDYAGGVMETKSAGITPIGSVVYKEGQAVIQNPAQYSYKAVSERRVDVSAELSTNAKTVVATNSDGTEKELVFASKSMTAPIATITSYYRWYIGVMPDTATMNAQLVNSQRNFAGHTEYSLIENGEKKWTVYSRLTNMRTIDVKWYKSLLCVLVPSGYEVASVIQRSTNASQKPTSRSTIDMVLADGQTRVSGTLYVYKVDTANGMGTDADGDFAVTIGVASA